MDCADRSDNRRRGRWLVNNAGGVAGQEMRPIEEVPDADCGQPLDMAGEILADSRRIALDHGCSRKVSAQHRSEARLLLDGDDALERTAGPHEAASQTAGSRPQFEDRSRSFQFDKTRESVGEMGAARVG